MSAREPTALNPLPTHELCAQANPDRLFVIASLFSARPKALTEARVLELGAGHGGNIVSLATMYPATRFTAEVADERAAEAIRSWQQTLDLANLEVRVGASQSESEAFDYILCPHAFRALEREQRSELLTGIKNRLAPQGVALMAYPVLPGAYFERMTGEMMAYHAGQFSDPASRAPQARAMLDFLANSAEPQAYRTLLGQEAERLRGSDVALSQTLQGGGQQALYVNDFFGLAQAAGLQYLGEAPLSAMLPENFGESIAQTLRRIGADVFRSEQYIDFLSARRQRFSLLMHAGVGLDRNVTAQRIGRWHVAANVREEDGGRFIGPGGGDFTARSPLTRRVLSELARRWPQSEALAELLQRFELAPDAAQASTLMADLLQCYMLGAVELRSQALPVSRDPGENPQAWPVARFQAQATAAGARAAVPCALHAALDVDEFTRYLLGRLDGSRDRAALLRDLEAAIEEGVLSLQENGRAVTESARRRELLSNGLDQALQKLGQAGLLCRSDA